jgi:hypothetical protein
VTQTVCFCSTASAAAINLAFFVSACLTGCLRLSHYPCSLTIPPSLPPPLSELLPLADLSCSDATAAQLPLPIRLSVQTFSFAHPNAGSVTHDKHARIMRPISDVSEYLSHDSVSLRGPTPLQAER